MKAYLLTHPNALKALSPGRVVTVYTTAYHYGLAVVLQQHSSKSSTRSFTVLMLCNSGDEQEEKAKALVNSTSHEPVTPYRALGELFMPAGAVKHAVVTVDGQLVFNITEEVVDVESKKIIDDYNKRQIPRFRQVCRDTYKNGFTHFIIIIPRDTHNFVLIAGTVPQGRPV